MVASFSMCHVHARQEQKEAAAMQIAQLREELATCKLQLEKVRARRERAACV